MLGNSLFRLVVILLLTGLLCAWMACPAVGQPADEAPVAVPDVEPVDQPDLTETASRTPIFRMGGVPNMFGDLLFTGGQAYVSSFPGPYGLASLPPIGGGRVKISENNKALPMDRVFFTYNHYQNGIQTTGNLPPASIDQYTIGLEKTCADGLGSVELRMPFMGAYGYSAPGFNFTEPAVGNLTVTLKRSIYQSYSRAGAVGLCVTLPTGGGTTGQLGNDAFTIRNDALYLVPWIGFLSAPTDRIFYQGFLQVDIAAMGNSVYFDRAYQGKLFQQSLVEVDLNVGYWLYQNPYAYYLTGLAGILEIHYGGTLDNAQLMQLPMSPPNFMQLGNALNRMDIWNLTAGLHAAVGELTTVRVGAVVPLGSRLNRLFDGEVQVSVNRYY